MKVHFVILILVFLGAVGCGKPTKEETIPEFTMRVPGRTYDFNSKNIPSGKPIVLVQFDPNCRECQIEAEYIVENINSFKNVRFYFVTRHPYEEMMVFHDHLKLSKYNNITIGQDSTAAIPRFYKIRTTPLLIVFNGKKRMKAIFEGKPDLKKLSEEINGL